MADVTCIVGWYFYYMSKIFMIQKKIMKLTLLSVLSLMTVYNSSAQNSTVAKTGDAFKSEAAKNIQVSYDRYKKIALNIWDYAEVGYKENKSSLLLQNTLSDNGFTVEPGVAGMPTAFV